MIHSYNKIHTEISDDFERLVYLHKRYKIESSIHFFKKGFLIPNLRPTDKVFEFKIFDIDVILVIMFYENDAKNLFLNKLIRNNEILDDCYLKYEINDKTVLREIINHFLHELKK